MAFHDITRSMPSHPNLPGPAADHLKKQVGGDHYKSAGIQPVEYIEANKLDFFEGSAIKYITRHAKKNGKEDLQKAIHYLEMLIAYRYPDSPTALRGDSEP